MNDSIIPLKTLIIHRMSTFRGNKGPTNVAANISNDR